MNMEKQLTGYESPIVDVIEIEVEGGFATSNLDLEPNEYNPWA